MASSEILKWDSDFFNFVIARINDGCISTAVFGTIYEELKSKKTKLIYWPSEVDCHFQDEIAGAFNGRFVDRKTKYTKELRKFKRYLIEDQTSIEFYTNKKPVDRVLEIAVQCGEYSRFKVDPDFPRAKFIKLYKTWIIKSLTGDLADEVIITRKDDLITGLVTVRCEEKIGNIGLVGVHDNYRGMGYGGILIRAALNYFYEKECYAVEVITQGLNQAACGLYEKFGFAVSNKTNFYHFWIK